ncbi:phosphotransferase family protein [Rhodopseudomonas sp. P2A-2r]|uniref:phosphotransferase family protein n=1 Tax=unclassified Rhodopseudomonas TaxID=2638247 RepID=UPI0022349673|nr:phosphotransferase family protein [Rhodopseudomonas sp. P2A-2r]UZE51061.1 phosphotransferase family protein [Rhodopseudomonas sp. P2A-2r]
MASNDFASFEFDPHRLEKYLKGVLPDLAGPMGLQRIGGGQSNPTFFVEFPDRCLVLRKKPAGDILPSAHAVDREYRVLTALARTGVPVPTALLYEEDPRITGTPFYVMERVEGRVFHDCSLPGVPAEQRRAMYFAMADTLGALHRVAPSDVGLADYGRPGNYFSRQIARWSRQYAENRTRDIPSIERVIDWLPVNIPQGEETAISHGDFRLGNLMFHPEEPRIVAVLDWELSTLGHPLADAAYSCLPWHTLPSWYGGIMSLDHAALGLPSEAEYRARYNAASGRSVGVATAHVVFALFRFAIILEGVAARARSGAAASDNAHEVGALATLIADRAAELAETGL